MTAAPPAGYSQPAWQMNRPARQNMNVNQVYGQGQRSSGRPFVRGGGVRRGGGARSFGGRQGRGFNASAQYHCPGETYHHMQEEQQYEDAHETAYEDGSYVQDETERRYRQSTQRNPEPMLTIPRDSQESQYYQEYEESQFYPQEQGEEAYYEAEEEEEDFQLASVEAEWNESTWLGYEGDGSASYG